MVMTDRRKKPDKEKPKKKRGDDKFIEKTDYCTRSKYREKYNLSRSVNSFERIRSVSDKLEIL